MNADETHPLVNQEVLARQYTAAVSMLSLTNTRRTATARFYISLVSGLVGLLAIVLRPGVETETQLWITNLIGLLAVLLSFIWYMTIRAMRHLSSVQKSLLKEMEKSLPHDFITRQEASIKQTSWSFDAGVIEQFVPLIMMVPPLVVLLISNLGLG